MKNLISLDGRDPGQGVRVKTVGRTLLKEVPQYLRSFFFFLRIKVYQ